MECDNISFRLHFNSGTIQGWDLSIFLGILGLITPMKIQRLRPCYLHMYKMRSTDFFVYRVPNILLGSLHIGLKILLNELLNVLFRRPPLICVTSLNHFHLK